MTWPRDQIVFFLVSWFSETFTEWLLCNTMWIADDFRFLWYCHHLNFVQGWNVDFIYRSLVKEKSGEVVMELIVLEGAKKSDCWKKLWNSMPVKRIWLSCLLNGKRNNLWIFQSLLNYFLRVEIHMCRLYIQSFYSQGIIVLKSKFYL